VVEGVGDGLRVDEEQGALAEIVEDQRRHDEAEPGNANREAAEVAHVGIQRFAAGHGEHHRAEGEEGEAGMFGDEHDGEQRVEGEQDSRIGDDLVQSEGGQDTEPGDHDRAEELADGAGAVFLDDEQAGQDAQGDRDDVGLEVGGDDFQSLDGGEHRNGRRDHAVAEEQGCGKDAEQGDDPGQKRVTGFFGNQREERQ